MAAIVMVRDWRIGIGIRHAAAGGTKGNDANLGFAGSNRGDRAPQKGKKEQLGLIGRSFHNDVIASKLL